MSKKPKRHAPNNKPLPFKQSDMERAIRGARAQGLPIGRVEIDPHTGRIVITTGTPNDSTAAELDDWVARKNARQA